MTIMDSKRPLVVSRRKFIAAASTGACCLGAGSSSPGSILEALQRPGSESGDTTRRIHRTIPSTGEKIPVIGLGVFGENISATRDVLHRYEELGGGVIHTAAHYWSGNGEKEIGGLVATARERKKLFIGTKLEDDDLNHGSLDRSFDRFRTDYIDWSNTDFYRDKSSLAARLNMLRQFKQAGKIRYIGVTVGRGLFESKVQHEGIDFVYTPYSIGNRVAERSVLSQVSQEERAVLIFQTLNYYDPKSGNKVTVFDKVRGRKLPTWAGEFGARSWAQFALKYVVSHPAVTAATVYTTNVSHLDEDLQAGCEPLPDEAMRRRMAEFWDLL